MRFVLITYTTLITLLFFLMSGTNFPHHDYKESILIDDPSGMLIKTYNVNLNSQFQKTDSIGINLDGSGKDDLLIKSVWLFSSGGGDASYVLFESINHSLELRGDMGVDSLFSRFEEKIDTFNNGDSILITTQVYGSCARMSSEDLGRAQSDNPTFTMQYSKSNEVLEADKEFHHLDYQLRNGRRSASTGSVNQVGANTYQKRIDYYDNTCNNLPLNEEFYLTFRMRLRGVFRLGWLKLVYEGSNNLTIIESAIQE